MNLASHVTNDFGCGLPAWFARLLIPEVETSSPFSTAPLISSQLGSIKETRPDYFVLSKDGHELGFVDLTVPSQGIRTNLRRNDQATRADRLIDKSDEYREFIAMIEILFPPNMRPPLVDKMSKQAHECMHAAINFRSKMEQLSQPPVK